MKQGLVRLLYNFGIVFFYAILFLFICRSYYQQGVLFLVIIIFAFSVVHRHTWFPVISRKSIYPIFTKFGMGVYWVNSLHGIAFGEDSCIANWVIAT